MIIVKLILLFIGVLLLLGGFISFIYIRINLKPNYIKNLDDYYYEFEDQHPGLQKYDRLSSLAKITIAIGVLFLFIVFVI
jgi:hypothetical protein